MDELVFIVKAQDETKKTFEEIKQNATSVGEDVTEKLTKGLTGWIGKIGASLLSFEVFSKAIENASNFNESINKLGLAFGNLNQANKIVDELSNNLGLSKQTAIDFLSSFKLILSNLGLSEQVAIQQSEFLTRLATDLSSFYNISLSEAAQTIQSTLAGQYDSLRKFGVVINENVILTEALERGWGKNLSQAQKTAIVLDLLKEKFGVVIGDATRTADSFANTQRRLVEQIQNLLASIGQGFLQIITPILRGLEEILKVINWIFSEVINKIPIIQGLVIALIAGISGALLGSPLIGLIVGILTLIIHLVVTLVQRWDLFIKGIETVWNGLVEIANGIMGLIIAIGNFIFTVFSGVYETVKAIFGNVVAWIIEQINNLLGYLNNILGKVGLGLGKIQINIETKDIKQVFNEQLNKTQKAFQNIGNQFQKTGNSISKGWSQITKGFSDVVGVFTTSTETLENVANSINQTAGKILGSGSKDKKEEKEDTLSQKVSQALSPIQSFLDILTTQAQTALVGFITSLVAGLGSLGGIVSFTNIGIAILAAGLQTIASSSVGFQQLASLLQLVGQLIGLLIVPVLNSLVLLLQPIIQILYILFTMLSSILQPFVELLTILFGTLGEILISIATLLQTFAPLFIAIGQILNVIFQFLRPFIVIITAIVKVFVVLFNNLIIPVVNIIITIANFIIGVIEGLVNGVIGVINAIIDAINWALGWAGVRIQRIQNLSIGRVSRVEPVSLDFNPNSSFNTNFNTTGTTNTGTTNTAPPATQASGVSVQQPTPIYVYFTNNGVLVGGFRNEDEFIDWIRRGLEIASRRVS